MKKIINFLRKIGLIQKSSGNYITGEFDDRKDLKDKYKKIDDGSKKIVSGFVFLKIIVIVGLLLLLLTLIILGFSFWFFVFLFVWLWFIFYTKKTLIIKSFVLKKFFMIFLVIIFFNLIFVISFSTTSNQINSKVNNNDIYNGNTYNKIVCEAKHLERKTNKDITLKIVDEKNNNKTKKVYTMGELSKLGVVADVIVPDNGIYLSSQICYGDEPVSFKPLSKMFLLSKKKVHSNKQMHYNSIGQYMNMIQKGKYQIYSYYSNDGETWYIDKEIDFEVK